LLGPVRPVWRVLFASMIGTAIEFFDFYIYAVAAVLVFPRLFFPKSDPTVATLESLATFALAFFARPVGSMLFGHFGDRIGRKATLVTALLTMGLSTVAIGLLPTYGSIGVYAALLLALCRVGRALGSAASGAGRCCWQRRTHRLAGRPGTAASRSSVHRSDSCARRVFSCCWASR
jgi:MFS family permease